jgi:hypothetical protein
MDGLIFIEARKKKQSGGADGKIISAVCVVRDSRGPVAADNLF